MILFEKRPGSSSFWEKKFANVFAIIRVRVYRFDKTFRIMRILDEAEESDHKTKQNQNIQDNSWDLSQYLGASESKLMRITISGKNKSKNINSIIDTKCKAMLLCLSKINNTRRVSA